MVDVKICGLSTAEAVDAAVDAGADYLGFIFYPKSPRNISPARAGEISANMPASVKKVAVVVDAEDSLLEQIVHHLKPDYLQLHGNETIERAAEIKDMFGISIIKAQKVRSLEDIAHANRFTGSAELLLFDAPPPDALTALPGGNGLTFDWSLILGANIALPWMLSGGLTVENVSDATVTTDAVAVDVSSGVESSPGVKDLDKIRAFIQAAKGI